MMDFKAPMLVQAQAIPVILSGRHVLVNAATGTGKTIMYFAPIIHHLQGVYGGLMGLLVYEILQKLLQCCHWIVQSYIMGGENRSKEKARLHKVRCRHICTCCNSRAPFGPFKAYIIILAH